MAGLFGNSVGISPLMTTSIYKSIYNDFSSYVSPARTQGLFSLSGYGMNLAGNGEDVKQNLIDLKDYATQLKDAANQLVSGFPPLMDQMVAVMEDLQNAVEVKQTDLNKHQRGESFNIEVKQIASAQVNKSTALPPQQTMGAGQYTMDINGKSLSLNTTEDDNFQSIQQKLADAINKGDYGIKARTATQGGGTQLILEGKTGASNAFTISDTEGDLAAQLGIHQVETTAKNAVYSVNGTEKESSGNDVAITGGLTVTLQNTTNGKAAKLSIGADKEEIAPRVRDLVDGFNGLLQTLTGTGNKASDLTANKLIASLGGAVTDLAKAGIMVGRNGALEIDEKRLSSAMEDGSLQKALGDGFASQVSRTAAAVTKNPAAYMNTTQALTGFSPFGQSGYGQSGSAGSPFTPRNQYIGMLFESFI